MKSLFAICMFLALFFNSYADDIPTLIKKAGDSSKYPGSGYVTVFDSTKVDVLESGLSYVNARILHKVLTPYGALGLRSIILDYDPLSAWIEFKKVKVWKKNGEVKEVSLKKVKDYPAYAHMIYWGARQKMINIGRLEVGDAIEIEYKRKGYTYALLQQEDEKYIPPMRGHFYDIVAYYANEPVLLKYYSVSIPSAKKLKYKIFNSNNISVTKTKEKSNDIFSFTGKDLMPVRKEKGMVSLSNVAPKVLMSTASDWESKSRWFYKVNEDYKSFESFKELDDLVNDILKDATTEYDSIAYLTHWVADNIRYCGVSMGKGEGYTLHNAKMNYHDRCGVCKDKAGMLIAMLRSAGFESYPAMTMAGSRIEDIPADQFNHCVTLVKVKSGKYKILDPTWVPFVRELWSSAEQQQNYLPGIPGGADLQITPVSPAKNHYINIKVNSTLGKDGTLRGTISLTAEGQSDSGFRRIFTSSLKSSWDNKAKTMLCEVDQRIKIDSMNYGNPYDYSRPFSLYVSFAIPNYALVGQNNIVIKSFASNLFLSKMSHLRLLSNLPERKYGFKDRCTRLVNIQEEIKLPSGYSIAHSPKVNDIEGKAASFKGGYSLDNDTMKLNINLSLNKRVYEKEDWPVFKEAIEAHNQIIRQPVILEYNKK